MEFRAGDIGIRVASGFDDLMTAMMIRAAVFVGECGRTIGDEADGNDCTATHLLATVGGVPAGTMRIRYFGQFAKPERMAILSQFRRGRHGAGGVARELGSFSFRYCRAKGFTNFYGHAREGLERFWAKFAEDGYFEPMCGAIEASGDRGIPMYGTTPPLPGAIGAPKEHENLAGQEAAYILRVIESEFGSGA